MHGKSVILEVKEHQSSQLFRRWESGKPPPKNIITFLMLENDFFIFRVYVRTRIRNKMRISKQVFVYIYIHINIVLHFFRNVLYYTLVRARAPLGIVRSENALKMH